MAEKPDHDRVFRHVQAHLTVHKDQVLGAIAGGIYREGGEGTDAQVVAAVSAENANVLVETIRHICISASKSLGVSMEELAGYILRDTDDVSMEITDETSGEPMEIPAPIPQPKRGSLEC